MLWWRGKREHECRKKCKNIFSSRRSREIGCTLLNTRVSRMPSKVSKTTTQKFRKRLACKAASGWLLINPTVKRMLEGIIPKFDYWWFADCWLEGWQGSAWWYLLGCNHQSPGTAWSFANPSPLHSTRLTSRFQLHFEEPQASSDRARHSLSSLGLHRLEKT